MYIFNIICKLLAIPFVILGAITAALANSNNQSGRFANTGSNGNSNNSDYLNDDQCEPSRFHKHDCEEDHEDDHEDD